jgi:hypothetical protein
MVRDEVVDRLGDHPAGRVERIRVMACGCVHIPDVARPRAFLNPVLAVTGRKRRVTAGGGPIILSL